LPEPEETGQSFAENATLKAEAAAKASGLPAVADDSGLEVSALGGAPGVNSARWGGPDRDFGLAMERVHRELEASGSDDRMARFVCVLAYARPNEETIVSRGAIAGTLTWPPRGSRGFGYDPIFLPDGYSETFGEMDPDRKNFISHRMLAFERLILRTSPLEEIELFEEEKKR
jgi:XTP/dITP diphosphohydrolase